MVYPILCCIVVSKCCKLIGGGNRGPWPLLNLRPLLRNVIFAIENHFSLAKWPPLLSVASSPVIALFDWYVVLSMQPLYRKYVTGPAKIDHVSAKITDFYRVCSTIT